MATVSPIPATPAPNESASIFVLGDIVLQNPRETAAIFCIVVILSIGLEHLFAFFRENRSKYVRLLFAQVSEEMMIIGMIGLIFVLVVQSVDNLPERWVLLFRWTQTVIFVMMVLFLLGVIITTLAMRSLLTRLKEYEAVLSGMKTSEDPAMKEGRLFQAYAACRMTYKRQLESQSSASALNQHHESCKRIPFCKYLEPRIRTTVVRFTDVTWQCWLSIIFAAGANSLRLFLLPGDLQTKSSDEFTSSDRVRNHASFIVVIGYLPVGVFVVAFILLLRKFGKYQTTIESHLSEGSESNDASLSVSDKGSGGSKLRRGQGGVWLPPKALTAELMGEHFEDPSRYLLRSNRSFTLHMMKIPAILVEFYFSIFTVGMFGEMARETGTAQVGLIPFAILPLVVLFALLPLALLIVTILTSLGSRLDIPELIKTAKRSGHTASRRTHTKDEEADESGSDHDQSVSMLHVPEMELDSTISNSPRHQNASFAQNESHREEVKSLKARIRFLEDVCQSYGIPIAGRTVDDEGNFNEQSSLATVMVSISKLQEQNNALMDQQQQIAALQRAQRLSMPSNVQVTREQADESGQQDSDPSSPARTQSSVSSKGASGYSPVDAISAAKRHQRAALENSSLMGQRTQSLSTPASALTALHRAASKGRIQPPSRASSAL